MIVNFVNFVVEKLTMRIKISSIGLKGVVFNKKAFQFWLFFVAVLSLILMYNASSYDWKKDDIYIFLRLYIFCISIYFAFLKFEMEKINIAILFIATGILFNLLMPFYYKDSDTIGVLAVVAMIFFGYFSHKEYKKLKNNQENN
jgi:hypothetical protein